YDYDFSQMTWVIVVAIAGAIGFQGEFGLFFGQYRRRWRYGSFEEVRGVACSAVATGVALTALLWREQSIPRSVPIMATGLSLLGHVAARSVWRLYNQREAAVGRAGARKIVIVGAGDGAVQILRTLRETPNAPFNPVALVDDDPTKRNLEISGVQVVGCVDVLVKVALHYQADAVLIAIPSADGAMIRKVTGHAEGAGLEVFVLPSVDELFGSARLSDIRPVDHEDLLGRRPAEIDTALVSEYITGRRVMVTGAGGSIGSEICRQLAKFEPAELQMLDRDETGLHGTQLSLTGRALLENRNLILADIRDASRMDEVFAEHRPEVVFHTAALKHLPLLEMHPDEGWKTNVCGTLNLLEVAGKHGVDRFVNVSTDKAAAPTSVLGWTKRITERLTAWANTQSDTKFVSVRFGNVLGSNGSVLKSFEVQAANGGPITVTHPDITRFFMTIEEASRLTIHAGAIGQPGEIMILDMGEPVKILDVAKRFANQHTPPLEIVFTGLRKNEKMHEDLMSGDEDGHVRSHPLITHVPVPPLRPVDAMHAKHAMTSPSVDQMAVIAQSEFENHSIKVGQ
ncbi:polysaccharide biosynthesis protein, partial [Ilumatobacter sp.]|uniref:polysaccharide biosynthesis protein n=1 Tax=Ilumatobacter sp. TaxID=1967498 RepID=UPI0037523470